MTSTPQTSATSEPVATRRRPRRFALKLADLGRGRWMAMSSDSMGGWANPEASGLYGPGLLDQHFGTTCNYGTLFTYLFRRFGFPNLGSDDYKEIACWALTTPLPDMVLTVSPSVGDWPRLSLRFLVTEQAWDRVEREPREQWTRALAAWVEEQGLIPAWLDNWLAFWRTKPGIASITTGDRSDWIMSIADMHFVQFQVKERQPQWSDELYALLGDVAAFVERITRDYEAIVPNPAHLDRGPDWRTWPDSDPLKRYHAAAAVALEDLSRPVRVRDAQINAHGPVAENDPLARRTLSEPPVAGYAIGSIGNAAPEEVATLHEHVRALGKGNVKRGVAKLLALAGLAGDGSTDPSGKRSARA